MLFLLSCCLWSLLERANLSSLEHHTFLWWLSAPICSGSATVLADHCDSKTPFLFKLQLSRSMSLGLINITFSGSLKLGIWKPWMSETLYGMWESLVLLTDKSRGGRKKPSKNTPSTGWNGIFPGRWQLGPCIRKDRLLKEKLMTKKLKGNVKLSITEQPVGFRTVHWAWAPFIGRNSPPLKGLLDVRVVGLLLEQ